MIGIIVAEEKELLAVKEIMTTIEEINIYEKIFYKGSIENKNVVVVKSNVGKVNSARVCQILIDRFNPSLVINVGTAGSVDNKLDIGDIVVANKLVQYDFDVTPFGRKLGEIENIGEYINEKQEGVEILGIHLEGPFVSPKFAGAQPLEYIVKCDIDQFNSINEASLNTVKQVSYACEENGLNFTTHLVNNGIVASIGHSNSDYATVVKAADLGATSITHTYNAQKGLHHRDIGVVGAAMLDDRLSAELICDLIHVSPAAIKLLFKNKGKDNICLITDSIEAKYMPDGEYSLGGQPVFVKDNVARLENGTLAGSTLKLNEGVRNFMNTVNISLAEAVDCATINPARVLGIADRKGSIELGKDADLIVVDKDLNVYMTICRGNVVYSKL